MITISGVTMTERAYYEGLQRHVTAFECPACKWELEKLGPVQGPVRSRAMRMAYDAVDFTSGRRF